MSFSDPRDPRDPGTARYEPDYRPESRAYSSDPNAQYAQGNYAQGGYPPPQPRPRRGPNVNVGMFVGGVVMSGVVTGLAAWLAAFIIRAIVDQVNESGKYGIWNPVARDEYWFAVVGFLCALAAGALWYVLQISTPSPDQFYTWIVGLLVAAAVIIPLVLSAQVSVKIGTAVMHLIIGLPLLTLIPAMGRKTTNQPG